MMHLIDSHCHPPPDAADWLANARRAGVAEWIAIGTDPSDWNRHASLAASEPGAVHWTAGLHPSHVTPRFEHDLDALAALLDRPPDGPPPRAVGEIGLDFTRLPKEERGAAQARQEKAFAAQLALAAEHRLPVVIHSRGTALECLAILRDSALPPERAVFHCFAEGPGILETVRSSGARCSFTGIPTFRNAGEVREALRLHGPDDLILETDSPYLSPEPFRGKPNEPARLRVLAEFCAEFFGRDLETVAETTTRNARDFFQLAARRT